MPVYERLSEIDEEYYQKQQDLRLQICAAEERYRHLMKQLVELFQQIPEMETDNSDLDWAYDYSVSSRFFNYLISILYKFIWI